MTAVRTPVPASIAQRPRAIVPPITARLHVAILSQYYAPEIGAPQARLASLTEGLVRRGHAVTVLTAMPNYPSGTIQPGFGGVLRREVRFGARVLRSWILPTRRLAIVPRLGSYLSFAASALLAGSLLLPHADYLLVESPPLFLGLAGIPLARLKRARLIFNVSDLWPESAVQLGVIGSGSLGHRMSAALEARCYRAAWLVTGQTRDIVADIGRRFPGVRTHHLPNGVDTSQFGAAGSHPDPSVALPRTGARCTVMYAGLHGLAQGLDQLLDAARELTAESGIAIVLLGDGPSRAALMARAERERLRHVHFLPPRPHAEIPAALATSDIVVVPLHASLTNAVPSKLYEAMASGRPVVLVASGDAAEMVRRADAGMVVPHNDAGALAEAFRRLADDPALRARLGENGRRFATRHCDRARIADEFIDLLEAAGQSGERTHA